MDVAYLTTKIKQGFKLVLWKAHACKMIFDNLWDIIVWTILFKQKGKRMFSLYAMFMLVSFVWNPGYLIMNGFHVNHGSGVY